MSLLEFSDDLPSSDAPLSAEDQRCLDALTSLNHWRVLLDYDGSNMAEVEELCRRHRRSAGRLVSLYDDALNQARNELCRDGQALFAELCVRRASI